MGTFAVFYVDQLGHILDRLACEEAIASKKFVFQGRLGWT